MRAARAARLAGGANSGLVGHCVDLDRGAQRQARTSNRDAGRRIIPDQRQIGLVHLGERRHVCEKHAQLDEIAEVGPGSVLGEISLLDQEPRSATVVSSGNSKVAVIPADKLRMMMRHDMGMRCVMLENLARLICQRLRTANVQLDGVVAGATR